MPSDTNPTQSGLLRYLPAIYGEDPFMGRYLLAFEKILLGRDDSPAPIKRDENGLVVSSNERPDPDLNPRGLEQIIDGLSRLYDPLTTPDEFLPWLSKWTALSLRADMTPDQQRRFLAQIIRLYEYRGTQGNLVELLGLFLTATPSIEVLDSDPPYFFRVTITIPDRQGKEFVKRQQEIANALIELEKPAHTDYVLNVNTPTMQIGKHSTVGVDTMLGTTE